MPRTVLYASDVRPPEEKPPEDPADLLQPKSAGTPRKVKEKSGPPPAVPNPDGYGEKLLKYIPAETIAFYAPLAAIPGIGSAARWAILLVGLGITVLYLVAQAKREKLKPPPAYFVLGGIAFLAWALGTSDFLTAVAGVDAVWGGVILGAAVFGIPGIDEAFVT